MPWGQFTHSDFYVRYVIYAAVGMLGEVFFTALMDFFYSRFLCSWNVHHRLTPTTAPPNWRDCKNTKLTGYSFLWMFPIYGLLVFLEPLSFYVRAMPWPLRGSLYALLFMAVEFLAGWILKLLTGKCPWDYSYHKLSLKGYTRWDFFIVWFIAALMLERLQPVLIALTPHILNALWDGSGAMLQIPDQ